MHYLKFNGFQIPYSNSLAMGTEPNIINESVTLDGNLIADINGWRYSDVTLSWDYLKLHELQILLEETDPMRGTFRFEFLDPYEGSVNINALRVGGISQKTQFIDDRGNIVWTGIQITLRFPDAFK